MIQMQKLSIIGGIGPEATMNYYSAIIKRYQERIATDKVAGYVGAAANNLLKAGCDSGLMCGNTPPHLLFDQIQARTDLPLLSIVETAVAAAQQLHLQRLALLGTKFAMQNDFFIKPF